MSELLTFCHAPFRDVCRAPEGRGKDPEFLAYTDGLINEAASLLKAAFDLQAPAEAAALFAAGPAFFSEVMGLLEYNTIDCEVTSPLGAFFAAKGRSLLSRLEEPGVRIELGMLETMLREKEWVMRCVWGEETTGNYDADGDTEALKASGAPTDADQMMQEMDTLGDAEVSQRAMAQAREEVDRMSFDQLLQAPWPAFHGSALYVYVARVNHSCAPNLKVTYPGNSARISMVAVSPLGAGEELCMSYIKQDANVQTRRKQLLEWYGFGCSCPRCSLEDSTTVRRTQKRLK